MDQLFDDAFIHLLSLIDGWLGSCLPAIDLYQTENEIVVRVTLPCMRVDDVQINLTGEVLDIKAEMRKENVTKDKNYHIREQVWDTIERSVVLPASVVSDMAKAENSKTAILSITLPKADEAKPKGITIKTKQPLQSKHIRANPIRPYVFKALARQSSLGYTLYGQFGGRFSPWQNNIFSWWTITRSSELV